MKANQDGLQVLPWHREAAKELNEAFNLYCWDEAKDDAAAIIARHDPHESPLFTSRVLVPKLNAEIESLKAHHAETLRLLERADEVLADVSRYPKAGPYPDGPCLERGTHDDVCALLHAIRAHLAAQKGSK